MAATLLWLLASLLFRVYVVNFGNYEEAYGTLGAIILTLLWFYITALVMVVGAEFNAEIPSCNAVGAEPRAENHGTKKAPGPGCYRAIGMNSTGLEGFYVFRKNHTRPLFSV